MVRGHQFNKVEMFQFTRPEDSDDAFDELVTKAENLVKGLGFHFRTVKLPAGGTSVSAGRPPGSRNSSIPSTAPVWPPAASSPPWWSRIS